MTHPDTLQIPRAVVEQALEAMEPFAGNASGIHKDWADERRRASLTQDKPLTVAHFRVLLKASEALRAALQPQAAVTTSGPPERDNSKPAEQQGVFRKFNVQRTDGSDQPGGKHHGCEYFVLDVAHDQHAKPALEAYAVACATTHPQLSADMRERYGLQAQAAAEPVNAWQIFGMDGEPMFIQQDEASAKRYEDAGHTVKRLSYFTTPPATQATPVNLQPAHDAVTIDLLNDRVMRQQAALTAALGALKNSVDTVWEEYTEAERKYAAYDSRRAKLDGMKAMAQAHTDAIAQIEALGE